MLSTTTQYALRALVALTRLEEGTAVLGRNLSDLSGVPANYLSKILLDLKRIGVVAAARGTGGGYRLVRPAEEIHLIEVVQLFDPPRAEPGCLLGGDRDCSDEDPCSAHERWRAVRSEYAAFLDETTLADIATHGDSSAGL